MSYFFEIKIFTDIKIMPSSRKFSQFDDGSKKTAMEEAGITQINEKLCYYHLPLVFHVFLCPSIKIFDK